MWQLDEEEITLKEALELASSELSVFWYGSEPLVAYLKQNQAVASFSLKPEWTENNFLLFFLDPADWDGQFFMELAKTYHQRYHLHPVRIMLVFVGNESFWREKAKIQLILQQKEVTLPVVVDFDQLMSAAYSISELPCLLFLQQGQVIFHLPAARVASEGEIQLQEFLRREDPGLAFAPLLTAPEIQALAPAQRLMTQTATFFLGKQKTAVARGLTFSGKWHHDQEKSWTSDPQATLLLQTREESVALLAQALTPRGAKIIMEVNGLPVFDHMRGSDLQYDHSGWSYLRVAEPRFYEALQSLAEPNAESLNADSTPQVTDDTPPSPTSLLPEAAVAAAAPPLLQILFRFPVGSSALYRVLFARRQAAGCG